jgi:chromosome partitioning protein
VRGAPKKLPASTARRIVLAMIITVGHDKGGVGKTATATNLAVWFAHRGDDVLLLDADRQGASAHWAAKRNENPRLPAVKYAQALNNVAPVLRDMGSRYKHIIVDTGGHDSAELRSALVASHLLVTPVRPAECDVRIVDNVAKLLDLASPFNPHLTAALVLNFVPTNARNGEAADARKELETRNHNIPILSNFLSDRKAIRDAYKFGAGVIELDDTKAAAEFRAVAEEIYGQTSFNARTDSSLAAAV